VQQKRGSGSEVNTVMRRLTMGTCSERRVVRRFRRRANVIQCTYANYDSYSLLHT